MEWVSDLLNSWIPMGVGAGILGWLILAGVAPSIAQTASSWLSAMSPLVEGVSKGIVNFGSALWDGFKDMADNASSILFVVTVSVVSMMYVSLSQPPCSKSTPQATCEQCINSIRADYKFIPRTAAEKKEYLRRNPEHGTTTMWEKLFNW